MDSLEPLEDERGDTVFRDVIFLALAGFVAMVLLILPHLNPTAKAEDEAPSPGNVIVEIRWADEINADVDLWVEAPGDVPVGYSNKGGKIFNLLRDDLGDAADVTGLNYEVSYSRGIPAGEYTVNLHLFRNVSGVRPLPVTVAVSIKPKPELAARRVLAAEVALEHPGHELTVFRFELDEVGHLVRGSVHDLPRKLRSRKS